MGKLRGPKWDKDFERWKKLITSWLRLVDKNSENSEIVAAVILGLSESAKLSSGENVVDMVLDLEDEELYPSREGAMPEGQAIGDWKVGVFKIKDELRVIGGLANIIKMLQGKYGVEEETLLFNWYEEFESLRKDKEESMKDFINRFDRLYKKLERNELKLPEVVLAYRLMKSANLGKDELLAKVGVGVDGLTYKKMKATLLNMNDGVVITSNQAKLTPKVKFIKEEPREVLYHEECGSSQIYDDHEQMGDEFYDQEDFYDEYNDTNEVYFQNKMPRRMFRDNNRGRRSSLPAFGNRGSKVPMYHKNPSGSFSNHRGFQSNRGRANRIDSSGQRTGCNICCSIYHWANECPHNENNRLEKKPETILKLDTVFMDEEELCFLTNESQNVALLDCGAAKTIVGRHWYEIYENSLSKTEREKLREEDSVSHFKFGDGETVRSEKVKVIPVEMCGQPMVIKASLVDNKVPLLISNQSLKNAKAKVSFLNDTLEINGRTQKLITTSSGHYGIPIGHCENEMSETDKGDGTYDVFLESQSKSPEKLAAHLHRYFAHASPKKLKDFLKTTNHESKDEISKSLDKLDCEICKKHKKEAPKPKTCLPLAESFNETIALDLKFLDSEIILHCIDLLTRFSAATLIKNKTKETVVAAFMKIWIGVFGIPQQTLSDNGKEFCNQDFLDMCQNLNITMNTTAAYAPFSNGIVERHNGILAEMTKKIKEDVDCSTSIALSWALQAKNSMSNVYGFSPMQLVFGYNPKVPGLDDREISLGQLERVSSSELVASNLNAMFQARQAFLEAQNSDRLARALKSRVYQAYERRYFTGDKVYYRTGVNDKTWKGPGVVIGQHQKLVLVKHGGSFVRVHPSKLVLQTTADNSINNEKSQHHDVERENSHENTQSITDQEKEVENSSGSSDSDSEHECTVDEQSISTELLKEVGENSETLDQGSSDHVTEQLADVSQEASDIDDEHSESHNQNRYTPVKIDLKKSRYVLKSGDTIRYKDKEDDSWVKATILGPAGSARGVNKNWYNVQPEASKDLSVNMEGLHQVEKEVSASTLLCEQTENLIFFSKYPDENTLRQIKIAKDKELKNFEDYKVFEEFLEKNCKDNVPIVSSRWIINTKHNGLVKARLVARGFEDGQSFQSDAPTIDKTSQRLFLTVAAMKGWVIQSLDVRAAFLQSHNMERDVYLRPPTDLRKKGVVWKVLKPIYGLKDSAKNWFNTLKVELETSNCKQSILDPASFRYYRENQLKGMLISHVDDFLYAGDEDFHKKIIGMIENKFDISSKHVGDFDYVGISLKSTNEGIQMNQNSFSLNIQTVMIAAGRMKDKERNLDEHEKKSYQELLGKINWVSHQSRPDLAFDAYNASLSSQSPTVGNLRSLNKAVAKCKNGLNHILYPKLDEKSLSIVAYCDASLTNMADKVSSGEGFLVFLVDSSGNACLLNWKSKKVKRVVHSTLAAEGLSLTDCNGDASYIRNVVEELLFGDSRKHKIPIKIYTDSIQLRKALYSTHMVTEKLLRITIAEMKQVISNTSENTQVKWVKSSNMLSDCLTKTGASTMELCKVLEEGFIDVHNLDKDDDEKIGHASSENV